MDDNSLRIAINEEWRKYALLITATCKFLGETTEQLPNMSQLRTVFADAVIAKYKNLEKSEDSNRTLYKTLVELGGEFGTKLLTDETTG